MSDVSDSEDVQKTPATASPLCRTPVAHRSVSSSPLCHTPVTRHSPASSPLCNTPVTRQSLNGLTSSPLFSSEDDIFGLDYSGEWVCVCVYFHSCDIWEESCSHSALSVYKLYSTVTPQLMNIWVANISYIRTNFWSSWSPKNNLKRAIKLQFSWECI